MDVDGDVGLRSHPRLPPGGGVPSAGVCRLREGHPGSEQGRREKREDGGGGGSARVALPEGGATVG